MNLIQILIFLLILKTGRRNTNFDTRYRENSNLQNNLQIEPSRIETANKFTNTHGLIRTNNKFTRTSGLIEKQDVHTNTENPIRNIEPNEEEEFLKLLYQIMQV